jgi:hypothetical protein
LAVIVYMTVLILKLSAKKSLQRNLLMPSYQLKLTKFVERSRMRRRKNIGYFPRTYERANIRLLFQGRWRLVFYLIISIATPTSINTLMKQSDSVQVVNYEYFWKIKQHKTSRTNKVLFNLMVKILNRTSDFLAINSNCCKIRPNIHSPSLPPTNIINWSYSSYFAF